MRVEQAAGLSGDDREALLDFWVAAWKRVFPALDFDERRAWLTTHLAELMAAGAVLLVTRADAGGPPTGFLTLDPLTGAMDQIAVDPRHAGRGLARALIAEAKRRSPAGLNLRVNQANHRAIALYERAGFVTTGAGISPRSGLPHWTMAWPGPPSGD